MTDELAAELGAAGFDARAVPDVMRWKYTKLLMNLGERGRGDLRARRRRRRAGASGRGARRGRRSPPPGSGTPRRRRRRRGGATCCRCARSTARTAAAVRRGSRSRVASGPSRRTPSTARSCGSAAAVRVSPTPVNAVIRDRSVVAAADRVAPNSIPAAECSGSRDPGRGRCREVGSAIDGGGVLRWPRSAVRRIAAGPRRRGLCPDFLGFRLTSVRLFGKLQAMSFGADRGIWSGFCDPVGDLRTAVDRLVDQDPPERPRREWARICCGSGSRSTGTTRRSRVDLAAVASVGRSASRTGTSTRSAGSRWKTGTSRSELRRVVRLAELCELLPETGPAWRDGKITTTAVEMIAGARVADFDEELVAIEAEFLDFARCAVTTRALQMLTQHFRACARADGSKPEPPDEFTVADVGDRVCGRFDVDQGRPGRPSATRSRSSPGHRPRTTRSTLAQRQAEGLVRICEIALAARHRRRRCAGRSSATSPTHRTADDVTASDDARPVLRGDRPPRTGPDPLRRVIVPVTTDHRGEILNIGRATPVWNRAQRRAITTRSPHCQWPGCEIPAAWCDIHHVDHWEHGGETSTRQRCPSLSKTPHVRPPTPRLDTTPSTINSSACSEPTAPKSTPTPGTTSRPDACGSAGRERGDAVDAEARDEQSGVCGRR